MAQKKAIVWFTVWNIVGVISLVILIYFAITFFNTLTGDSQLRLAKESLTGLISALESAKSSGIVPHMILNPKEWSIVSYKSRSLYDICRDDYCLCLLKEADDEITAEYIQKKINDQEGICQPFASPIQDSQSSFLNKKIEKVPYSLTIKYFSQEDIIRMYNFNYLNPDPEMLTPQEVRGTKLIINENEERIFQDPSQIRKMVLAKNPGMISIVEWDALAYTSLPDYLIKYSYPAGIIEYDKQTNPFLVLAILESEHSLSDSFTNAKTLDEKINAAISVRLSVINRAKALLSQEDYAECEKILLPQSISPTLEHFNIIMESAIACCAKNLQKALPSKEPSEKYSISDYQGMVNSYVQNDSEKSKEIWKNFMFYIK